MDMNPTNARHLTPVDHIPSEILADILEMAAKWARPPSQRGEQPFQLVVGQVCGRWRSLVLNLPFLWNQLYIYRRTRPKFIRLCLQRSKDTPVDIFMALSEPTRRGVQWSTKSDIHNFMCEIILHSWRWRRLVVEVYDSPPLSRVLRYLKDTYTPRLEHVDLRTKHVSDMHLYLPDQFLAQNAHSLLSLRFHGLLPSCFPCGRLTRLDLTDVHFYKAIQQTFRNFVSMSPLLQHLRINHVFGLDEELTEPVILPSLLSLTIQNLRTEVVLSLLVTLRVKSLSVLRFIGVALDSPDHLQVFRDISTKEPRFPELDSLTVCNTYFPPKVPVEFYRGMPKVRHLALFGRHSAMLIRHIGGQAHYPHCMPDEGPVWPHLRIFSTADCIDYPKLQEILTARLAISCPIPHLQIYDPTLDNAPPFLCLGTGVEQLDLFHHNWDPEAW